MVIAETTDLLKNKNDRLKSIKHQFKANNKNQRANLV